MNWVLVIWILYAGEGIHSQQVDMASQEICELALAKMPVGQRIGFNSVTLSGVCLQRR
jgi:hypothetical protein